MPRCPSPLESSENQSLFSSFLPAHFPILSLALFVGALGSAVSLSSTLDLEKVPALSIGADSNIVRLKELPLEDAIQ